MATLKCLALLVTYLAACQANAVLPNVAKMQQEASADGGQVWAVLVAGSNGWWNYRHQADICHAYHILSKNGIPDTNIVVMMYDDIAHNSQNPTPGVIINKPNGPNYYPGTPKDYVGGDVVPETFLKILNGEATGCGSGKTLKSGPNDRVFVYFADHGATGLVAFPQGELYAKDLNDALKSMHAAKKYSQLVFYMEACESGSMFNELLPKDINVFAVTASNPFESSWGCYCENPEHLPCLGDLFSVKWMEDSDVEDLNKETLQTQFEIVKKATNKSHVMEYGDMSFQNEPVGNFQGMQKAMSVMQSALSVESLSPVESREVVMWALKKQYDNAVDVHEQQRLLKQINWMKQKRAYVDHVVSQLVSKLVPSNSFGTLPSVLMSQHPLRLTQPECHKRVAQAFSEQCFSLAGNPYALRYSFVLANLCELGMPAEKVTSVIEQVCAPLSDKPVNVE